MRTSVEKGLLLGPGLLTEAELVDAIRRAETTAAADGRLGLESGGAHLAEMFWAEKARRDAMAGRSLVGISHKDDPGPGDVHVNRPLGEVSAGSAGQQPERKTNKLPGGVGDKTKPRDVNRAELAMGVREEMEHTNDRDIAEEIALDHLTEDPAYYSKLRKVAKADRSGDPGVMVALRLPKATALQVAVSGGEPAESLHVTLAYLGRMSKVGPAGLLAAAEAINSVTSAPILRGQLSGVGRFAATESSGGKDVLVRLVDVPGLTDIRARLVHALDDRGLEVSRTHDFTPHLTLAYVEPKEASSALKRAELQDVYFDAIVLSVNDADTTFPLGQPDPLEQARLAALAAQAREAGDSSVAVPSAPAVVEDLGDDGAAMLSAFGGENTVELVAASAENLDLEPGDVVEVSADLGGDFRIEAGSPSVVPAPVEVILKSAEAAHERRRHTTKVPFAGRADARVVFVSGAPNKLELARGEALVGPDGAAFAERYLAALGLTRDDVAIGFACPVLPVVPAHEIGPAQTKPWEGYVREQLERWPDAVVVAVGKAAADALGDRALLWLPHPFAARSNEARYEQQIDRKVRRIRKAVDDGFAVVQDRDGSIRAGQLEVVLTGRSGEGSEAAGPGRVVARVAKSAGEKQIVYGVVLDPYEVDTQEEWAPPATIEQTAHGYLRRSRVVGREHLRKATADLVESWCVHYPTSQDYQAAMTLQPHRAYEMPFGDDVVHSGAWIAGVKLGDAEWAAYKRGEITGFSIGGFSAKVQVARSSMPKVEFVRLVEERTGRG
jgi:uracil-DNA glycosylase family 4